MVDGAQLLNGTVAVATTNATATASSASSSSLLELPARLNLLGTEVAPLTILLTVLIIVVGFSIAHFGRVITTKYIGGRLPPDTRKTMGKLIYYVIIAVALLSALGVSGIDLSGVFLAGGIAGIVIGFATQSLFSNLISGIFLQIDKPMKIGDPVLITGKLPDVAGVVVEITTLSSRLRMFDGTYVRLPNSDVFLSEIRNYSGAAARRIELVFGVAYKEDLAKVIATITETVTGTPLVLVEPVPDIYVDKIGDSAILVNVWCWAPYSVWFDLKKQLVQQIKEALDRAGIKIPLPQRVVHVMHDKRQDAENVDSRNASMSSMAGSG
ncbi:MAG TPA: mechanosensitive ion channel family protein [Nitrososphaera sp.]|nr:mechanosensitive ion channel family protein [Nitrososphaera sp.]